MVRRACARDGGVVEGEAHGNGNHGAMVLDDGGLFILLLSGSLNFGGIVI